MVLPMAACEDDPATPNDTGGGQAYEIKYETGSASGWFGGDNRAAFSPRTVGGGASVLVEEDIVLKSFSFAFDGRFDYSENPDFMGHDVTLPLNVRDAAGVILKTVQLNVPASYNGGWVTWTGIDLNVDAGTTVIFTTYLIGAYDVNEFSNGHSSDLAAGYANGTRYVKQATSDAAMEVWAGWSPHPWDAKFWLQGTTR
jgi:hypothetical protein